MDNLVTVFIADDHLAFLEGLKEVIAKDECVRLMGEATDGAAAWEQIVVLEPEMVLLDIDMPGLSGLEVISRINHAALAIKVILVTSYKEESLFDRAMELGVNGYVLKDDYVLDLPQALRSVSQGEPFVSPAILPFKQKREHRRSRASRKGDGLDDLTPQELRILRLLADNLRDRVISRRLSVSIEKLVAHREQIVAKLELPNDDALLEFARNRRTTLKGFKLIPQDQE